jgi:hypothetical protein
MKYLLTLIICCCLSAGYCQISVNDILDISETKQKEYEPQIKSGKQLYLKMNYGSSVILNSHDIKKLYGAKIASIDIVYSDHPKGDTYSSLTRKRIENLKMLYPTAFSNIDIKWNLIRQTDCIDKESASSLFHGIVITYRPAQSDKEIEKEIEYLKDILSKLSKGTSVAVGVEEIILDELAYLSDSIPYESIDGERGFVTSFSYPSFVDSSVISVLKRHNWSNMIIAADLTGSMAPYTAQLFVWLRLNTLDERVKQFVFFNDGNSTPDTKKIIGKTGGIYDTRSSNFQDVKELAFKTMRAGSGGDLPENNIEALIKSNELCPDCDNIVLIADNWAPIKDISLLEKLNKPVKIILCGSDYGVNTEYLELARKTGGSVHTMTDDLTDLLKLNEGQSVTIRGQTFKIEKGKFIKITKI